MKNLFFGLIVFCLALVGCTKEEAMQGNVGQKMKSVSISAEMGSEDTKASLDSQTGAFTWQSGDIISVLATDGIFYDFILEGECGVQTANFVGQIPETAEITTVATYPAIVENGTANSVYSNGTLNYELPAEWTYAKDVSNVPMVASFETGAEHMSFKQVGGVMRFPVNNLPAKATFVVKMKGKTITGKFPVDIAQLGTSAMMAGEADSELAIKYSSDVDGASAEFNVPVPVGVYNEFTVVVKDADGAEIYTKEYKKTEDVADNQVNRAVLMMMKEITLPERPMVISEVWPFYVDARVVFGKYEGVSQYAFYVDGSEEPVIKDAEDLGDMAGALVGGTFGHKTTHKVAVAKVVDGVPVAATMSEVVEFTTADIYQLTTNTGTKFVTVGWDDVAIANGTKYENGKWTALPKMADKDGLKGHQRRGYEVRLLAADKTTVIYSMITFAGHEAFTNAFSDSSWLGKIDGTNIMIPTALAFGYLEPGTDYYFQVRTLSEAVMVDETNGNYNPDGSTYELTSERGGCAWSELVKLSTDAAHVPSDNEILYEGFDDMMVHSDYVNWAPAVVPDLEQIRIDWATYGETNMINTYPAFLKMSAGERKWTVQAFSKQLRSYHLGFHDVPYSKNTDVLFNANAGSLEGWASNGPSDKRVIYPIFGAVRLGQSGSSGNGTTLKTPAINSDKLLSNKGTKCTITANVAYCATDGETNSGSSSIALGLLVNVVRDGADAAVEQTLNVSEIYPEEYASWVTAHNINANNYVHHQRYYELSCEMYLRKGDQIRFTKPTNNSNKGMLVIGEIKVEVIPGAYEQNAFVDNGIGTEPDNTNYDAFGLGEFPISYWWNIPTAAHNYDPVKTMELYQDMKNAGINVVNYVGEVDGSLAENKRIMEVCSQLDMKFIAGVTEYGECTDQRIAAIKDNLASNPTYVGEHLRDEPAATAYDELGDFTKRYMQAIPDKEVYINLYPTYASKLGTSSYEAYIEEYLDKIPTKTISYDHYGLMTTAGSISSDYYMNLDLVRSKTLDARKPYWVITQAGAVTSRKQPTEKEQRWSVWSTIAGGSKGIAYFCYWTPNDFDDYMIRRDGTKTDMYYYIKKLNADINTIGKKLLPCHADGMIISNLKYISIFDNAGKGRTSYGPVKGVSAVNNHVTVGCFRDARVSENGENYKGYKVLVVAQNPTKDIQSRLTLDASVTSITVTQNNVTKVVDLNNLLDYTLEGENGIKLTYSSGSLTLNIPEGEALLIEF